MLYTSQGIVLHNIKYADKKIISKIYSKEFGLLSANIHVGHNLKSKIKVGVVQPLTQIEFVCSLKENRELQQITEVKCTFVYTGLQLNFNKLCIAQFLNEILYKCLKEHVPNEELFELICNTYQWLDTIEEGYQDLHIYFLFQLCKHLGFYPKNNRTASESYFSTLDGKFEHSIKSYPLGFDGNQSKLFAELFDHTIFNPKKFSRQERTILLECLMSYYKMQVPGLSEIRSYAVVQEMMNAL